VIVDKLYEFRSGSRPNETNAPLIVHPNAVLSLPIAAKHFKSISRRNPKIREVRCGVKHFQFSQGRSLDLSIQGPHPLLGPDLLGSPVTKGADHRPSV
jgi:hypothetical protein